jgi:hypothetical protein
MSPRRRAWLLLLALVATAVLLSGLAPKERVLGSSLRIVYLHGAWVWAALLGFAAAAMTGLFGFILRRQSLHAWSVGLGRSATVFWLTSLLLSLAAMQSSWNGLYLAEPRWRLGVRFAVAALLLQVAVAMLHRPRLGSGLAIAFFGLLTAALLATPAVMHPSSPVFSSESIAVRASFLALLACAAASAAWLARLLRPNA